MANSPSCETLIGASLSPGGARWVERGGGFCRVGCAGTPSIVAQQMTGSMSVSVASHPANGFSWFLERD